MTENIGPNEHCPCGSGRKYKKCHGRSGGSAKNNQVLWMAVATAVVVSLGLFFLAGRSPAVAPGGSVAGAPARVGQPWEYDAASNTYYDPSPGHQHWHSGMPPTGQGAR